MDLQVRIRGQSDTLTELIISGRGLEVREVSGSRDNIESLEWLYTSVIISSLVIKENSNQR